MHYPDRRPGDPGYVSPEDIKDMSMAELIKAELSKYKTELPMAERTHNERTQTTEQLRELLSRTRAKSMRRKATLKAQLKTIRALKYDIGRLERENEWLRTKHV